MAAIKKKSYKEISLNYKNVPIIDGTRLRIIDLVMAKDNYKCSHEELCQHYPPLTLNQLQEAFSYYEDHETELDKYIEEEYKLAERLRKESQH